MIEYIITFLGIYLLCLFKFVAGPILGTVAGYGLFEIELVTVSGMMTSVLSFTYLGEWIKDNWTIIIRKKRNRFTKRTRMIVRVWKNFGIWGIALLTPVIFTPIGGTVILTSFGINKEKIIYTMLVSSLLWAIIMGLIVREIIDEPFFKYFL
ncbi:MAG: hypothetical protein WDZ72_02855 [Cyclobacteriaceae bacterium]